MNESGNLPFDRILLPPPPAPPDMRVPLGPRSGGLLDEIPVGPSILPPSRPPLSVTTPEKPAVKSESPPVEEPPASPPPEPRWVKEALRDLFTMNRKKTIALAVGSSVVVAALVINAIFSGGPGPLAGTPNVGAPLAEKAAPPAKAPAESSPVPLRSLVSEGHAGVKAEPPGTSFPTIPVLPPIGDGAALARNDTGSSATLPPIAPPVLPPTTPPTAAPKVTEIPPIIVPASSSEPAGSGTGSPPIPPPALPNIPLTGSEPRKVEPAVPIPPAVPPPGSGRGGTSVIAPPVLPGLGSSGFSTGTIGSSSTTELIPPPSGFTGPPMAREEPPVFRTTPPAVIKLDPPGGSAGGTMTLDKPPGASGLAPVRTSEVRSDFDLDLHEPRAGETYASISQLHYGNSRYAEALRAFNRNLELGRGAVEVPPLHILRTRYAQAIAPARSDEAPIRGVDWSPAPGRIVEPPTYDVTRDGTSLWDVAEETLGDRRQWKRIADANPGLDPNLLTKGTRIKLPLDAKLKR